MEPIVFDASSPSHLREFFRITKSLGIPASYWESNPTHAERAALLATHGYALVDLGGAGEWA